MTLFFIGIGIPYDHHSSRIQFQGAAFDHAHLLSGLQVMKYVINNKSIRMLEFYLCNIVTVKMNLLCPGNAVRRDGDLFFIVVDPSYLPVLTHKTEHKG